MVPLHKADGYNNEQVPRPWDSSIICGRKMAEIDLTGTAAERHETTLLIQSVLQNAINTVERKYATNAAKCENNTESSTDDPQATPSKLNMEQMTTPARKKTPAAQLDLDATKFADEEQLEPIRNLADDLESTTPASKKDPHLQMNSDKKQENGEGREDVRMESPSHFLRGTPESTEEIPNRQELNLLAAKVEELRIL